MKSASVEGATLSRPFGMSVRGSFIDAIHHPHLLHVGEHPVGLQQTFADGQGFSWAAY